MRSFQFLAFGMVVLLLPLGRASGAGGAAGPAPLTVHIAGGSTRTALRLQPGFATVLRADHRVDTVAIGDPRLVTATTVKRGQDVYDVVLQPQTATGTTNMIVWLGDVTSIWDLTIGPGLRTADVVYVVTAAPAPVRSAPLLPAPPQAPGSEATTPPPAAAPQPRGNAAESAHPDVRSAQASEPPGDLYLEVQQGLREATGVFQLSRERTSVKIRYRITNHSAMDFAIHPNGILVRVNGRLAPFAMSRSNVDNDRPAVLPSGATEAGVVSVPARAPREIEVIFSLFPAADGRRGPSQTMPASFQFMFTGLERLTTSTNP